MKRRQLLKFSFGTLASVPLMTLAHQKASSHPTSLNQQKGFEYELVHCNLGGFSEYQLTQNKPVYQVK